MQSVFFRIKGLARSITILLMARLCYADAFHLLIKECATSLLFGLI